MKTKETEKREKKILTQLDFNKDKKSGARDKERTMNKDKEKKNKQANKRKRNKHSES